MLVKLKGYYNQGGDILPPESIINLPDDKAKALVENNTAEVYNPVEDGELISSSENSSKKGKTGSK